MYALITGASSGIGKEIAYILAEKGYNLIITARRLERLEQIKKEITKKYNVNVEVFKTDLSVQDNVFKLFEKCKEYDITAVINNAGFGKIGLLSTTDITDEISMINTNITAAYMITKLFSQHMQKGHILNVASLAAFQPGPVMAVYAATKAFLLSFSLAAGYEIKKQGKPVYISTLCPGPVDTEFNDVAGGSFGIKAMTAKKCADIAIKGMLGKKKVIIPGVSMKAVRLVSFLAPLPLKLKAGYKIQKNKSS